MHVECLWRNSRLVNWKGLWSFSRGFKQIQRCCEKMVKIWWPQCSYCWIRRYFLHILHILNFFEILITSFHFIFFRLGPKNPKRWMLDWGRSYQLFLFCLGTFLNWPLTRTTINKFRTIVLMCSSFLTR